MTHGKTNGNTFRALLLLHLVVAVVLRNFILVLLSEQQSRFLVIVRVFVLRDAVFHLFSRRTIWTRASVVTSRVRGRFDVLLTVFAPLESVWFAHTFRSQKEREMSDE